MIGRTQRYALTPVAGVALALSLSMMLLLGVVCTFPLAAPARAADDKPMPVFAPDKGKFRILVNGQQVGKEEFEISANSGNWIARGNSEIQAPEGVTRISGTLELHADGSPARYEWATQGAKKASAAITFSGATATIELHLEGARPFTQQFTFNSPRVAVLDNNLYHQYAVLARIYDWSRRGTQSYSVLIPQELTPGTVTVDWAGAVSAGGKAYEGLKVSTSDLQIILYLDTNHRLMRLEVPSANVVVVRE